MWNCTEWFRCLSINFDISLLQGIIGSNSRRIGSASHLWEPKRVNVMQSPQHFGMWLKTRGQSAHLERSVFPTCMSASVTKGERFEVMLHTVGLSSLMLLSENYLHVGHCRSDSLLCLLSSRMTLSFGFGGLAQDGWPLVQANDWIWWGYQADPFLEDPEFLYWPISAQRLPGSFTQLSLAV